MEPQKKGYLLRERKKGGDCNFPRRMVRGPNLGV